MTTVKRGGFPYKLPPDTIVLPSWQTPAFCRRFLKGRLTEDQRKRYEAIAAGVDWNRDRGWRLVWLEADDDKERL